jgi:hypothetical protein
LARLPWLAQALFAAAKLEHHVHPVKHIPSGRGQEGRRRGNMSKEFISNE